MGKGSVSKILTCTLIGFSVLLGGCIKGKSPPSRFYVLDSLKPTEPQEERAAGQTPGPVIGIGPIEIPPYLDRPQIVLRSSNNQIDLAEYDQWAEPLKGSVPRILSENLSFLLSTDRVALFPWKRATPLDYRISGKLVRFDGTLGGQVTLVARWTLFDGRGPEVLAWKKSTFTESVPDGTFEAFVATMSEALAALSRDMAAAIRNAS